MEEACEELWLALYFLVELTHTSSHPVAGCSSVYVLESEAKLYTPAVHTVVKTGWMRQLLRRVWFVSTATSVFWTCCWSDLGLCLASAETLECCSRRRIEACTTLRLRGKKTWLLRDKAEIINKASLQNMCLDYQVGDGGGSVTTIMIIKQTDGFVSVQYVML